MTKQPKWACIIARDLCGLENTTKVITYDEATELIARNPAVKELVKAAEDGHALLLYPSWNASGSKGIRDRLQSALKPFKENRR